ncbi:hypothetical protein [Rhizobium leguminosarum]|uniref:hypothetical protein n=1 Tax=Rhizobium leguminosarum TaxID=384 RepID=UPI0013E357CF|nr:hypothetical protein [Rhizobium leguminosarum]
MAYEPDMAIVFDSVTKAVIVSFRGATVYLPGPMLTEGGRPYRRSALPPTWLARLIATYINDPQTADIRIVNRSSLSQSARMQRQNVLSSFGRQRTSLPVYRR